MQTINDFQLRPTQSHRALQMTVDILGKSVKQICHNQCPQHWLGLS